MMILPTPHQWFAIDVLYVRCVCENLCTTIAPGSNKDFRFGLLALLLDFSLHLRWRLDVQNVLRYFLELKRDVRD